MSSTTQYTLDQYKTDAQKQLAQQRQATKQSADINYQKLMKYLPQQTKGYSIGMTETAKIAANNALQRQLAQADMDYAGKMLELNNYLRTEQERLDDKEYQRRWNEDEKEYNRGRDALMDQRYEDETEYNRGRDALMDQRYKDETEYNHEQDAKKDQQAKQNELFNQILGIIEGGAWNTGDELMNYVKSFEGKDGVTPDQYNVLMQYASSIADNPEQKAIEKDAADAKVVADVEAKEDFAQASNVTYSGGETGIFGLDGNAKDPGDNIGVKVGDKNLNVQLGQKIEGEDMASVLNAYRAANNSNPKSGDMFGYKNTIYLYKDGVLWSVEARGSFASHYSALYSALFDKEA